MTSQNPEDELMDRLEQRIRRVERRLEEQLARARDRAEGAIARALDRAVPQKNTWVADRSPARQELTGDWSAGPTIIVGHRKVDLYRDPTLPIIDDLMVQAFELRRYLTDVNLYYPTIYCETLDEYLQVYAEALDVSETIRRRWLEELKSQAEQQARDYHGGEYGVHWPGKGCYLNGWLFAYGRAESALAALRDPAIYPMIVRVIAHEKLGHGFLAEHSALGQEKTRLGLWIYDVARRFGVQQPDSPTSALLREKHDAIYQSSIFVEEGWATWIEHFISGQLSYAGEGELIAYEQALRPYPTLTQVRELLEMLSAQLEFAEPAQGILKALDILFPGQPQPVIGPEIHQAMLVLQSLVKKLDPVVAEMLGQPLPYVLGYHLVKKVEDAFGALCVPYAMLITANVTYDLERIASTDLRRLVTQEPRLNVDSRLAYLSFLVPQRENDVGILAKMAQEWLSFSVPANLKLPK